MGAMEGYEQIRAELDNKIQECWVPLTSAAENFGAGFVLGPRDIPLLEDPSVTFGIPLLDILSEMGLSLHFAVYESGKDDRHEIEERLRRSTNSAKLEISWFHNRQELDDWLRSDTFQIVYSDYSYDYRITVSGKSPFSMQIFELGIDGAIRMLERVLTLCRSTFYSRYNDYLKRYHSA